MKFPANLLNMTLVWCMNPVKRNATFMILVHGRVITVARLQNEWRNNWKCIFRHPTFFKENINSIQWKNIYKLELGYTYRIKI